MKDIFTQYSLPDPHLARIWDLVSHSVPGKLTRGEFRVALHLVESGEVPERLGEGLVGVLGS